VSGQKKPKGVRNSEASSPTMPCIYEAWSIAGHSARRIAGLLNGGCRWLTRSIDTKPVGSRLRTTTPRARRSTGSWSWKAYSSQSCSPASSDDAAAEVSPIVVHSTRS